MEIIIAALFFIFSIAIGALAQQGRIDRIRHDYKCLDDLYQSKCRSNHQLRWQASKRRMA